MHGFTYNGVNTADYSIRTTGDATWGKPSPIMDRVSVPGRNGELVRFTGAYENVDVIYHCAIPRQFQTQYDAFLNQIMSSPKYCRLEDTYHSNYYRMAMFQSLDAPVIYGRLQRTGEFDITFSCKPQTFLKSGEEAITLTATGSITNPTLFASKPLIRAYGTGYFVLGGETVTITEADGYTDIDCETENAYKDNSANNCNGKITLSGDSFPTIPAGVSTVTISGLTKLVITPKWWQL